MSEISNIRPWTHIHFTTKETEYFIDVHRNGIIEPDQWDFGTNEFLWLRIIDTMKEVLPGKQKV